MVAQNILAVLEIWVRVPHGLQFGDMAKLVYADISKVSIERCEGSIPSIPTIKGYKLCMSKMV